MQMNYLFIVILLLLIFFLSLLFKAKKGKRLFSPLILFIFIAVLLAGAMAIDHNQPGSPGGIADRIKSWIRSPLTSASSFLDKTLDRPIIKIKDEVLLDAPAQHQLPELPRGCEVTSLGMLLQHAGVQADKMALAKEIKKEPTPYKKENGKVYYGHPNDGFIGDMYSLDAPGLGVYHKPIKDLAEKYLPGDIIDLTGSDFTELKTHLSDGQPVWVITNTAYQKLSPDYFQTWETPSGPVEITYKEHSVLITGYDSEYVYFNDPLTGEKNKKAPIDGFEEAWVQMGRQAITYLSR